MFRSIDLRYILMVVINLLKSGETATKWDVFTVVTNPSWFKLCVVFFASVFVAFVSVRFSLISPMISFRPQNSSPLLLISFLAALILPQLLFWCIYAIIIFFAAFDCAAAVFSGFVQSVQAYFLTVPCFTISISTARTNPDAGTGDPDLEMGQPAAATPADPDDV